jgi:hypothetical protein
MNRVVAGIGLTLTLGGFIALFDSVAKSPDRCPEDRITCVEPQVSPAVETAGGLLSMMFGILATAVGANMKVRRKPRARRRRKTKLSHVNIRHLP